jgi:hypothetical protein
MTYGVRGTLEVYEVTIVVSDQGKSIISYGVRNNYRVKNSNNGFVRAFIVSEENDRVARRSCITNGL